MKIIVGLGNPGKEYEKTRHNAGAMCVDILRKKMDFPEFKIQKKFKALICEGSLKDEKILIAKPVTYMNLSGESVAALVNFYNCAPENLIVVYDDIDLPLGKIRVRSDGSPGSHNGMKSVTQSIGSSSFPRVRIGIESRGFESSKEQEISSFVLKSFTKTEIGVFEESLEKASEAVILIIKQGNSEAMQEYN